MSSGGSTSPEADKQSGEHSPPAPSSVAPPPAAPVAGSSRERRNGLACAECRRSKLKCDRAVPCQACVRRGCPSICPHGTLTATKGNKALQARAQKLDDQVKEMSTKIQDLEAKLAKTQNDLTIAQSMCGPPLHYKALLHNHNKPFQDTREPDNQSVPHLLESIGTLAISGEGVSKYYGNSSSSEYLSSLLSNDGTEGLVQRLRDPKYLGVPHEILQLVYAFPFGLRDCPYDKSIFLPFIPTRNRAQELVDIYYRMASWMFDPILSEEFNREIVDVIYSAGLPSLDFIHPHRLAIFFAILAHGVSHTQESSASLVQEQYLALAEAAVSIEPIIRGVTCSTIQAFYCIVRFLNSTVRSAADECWLLFGMCVRIAQLMGLQYDGKSWKLEAEELQRRRVMFWELYTWDAWNAFVMGRPPAMRLEDSDCKYPDIDVIEGQKEGELGFHAWKFRYTAKFLPWTVKHVFNPGSLTYEELMKLDRKIRTYPVPTLLQSPLQGVEGRPWATNPATAMQQYSTTVMKETNLLYIHRSFFAMAVHANPANPLAHKYGASVMATYRSACRMCFAMRGLHLVHGDAMSKIWYFWSAIFSSCVVLAALVLKSPGCALAQEALMELNSAYTFFEEGSAQCRPPSSMTILTKMRQRARDSFAAYHGHPNLAGSPPGGPGNDTEEISLLSGRHGVIIHASSSSSSGPSSNASQGSHASEAASPTQVPMSSMRSSLGTDGFTVRFPSQSTPASSTLDSPFVGTSSSSSGSVAFPSPSLHDFTYDPVINGPSNGDLSIQPVIGTGNDLYDFGMMDLSGYSDPVEIPAVEDAPGTGDYNKQHLWTTFIEGLMNDTSAPQFQ